VSDSIRNDQSAGPAAAGISEDERAELNRLRAEVATYRQQGEAGDGQVHRARPEKSKGRWRSIVAVILIVLGCLLAPLSVVGIWAHNQVSNTDRYVATVTPLASDPGVQDAIADRITAEIFNYVDVAQLTNQTVDVLARQGLPPLVVTQLRGLAGPFQSAVQNFVRGKVGEIVASQQFKDAWVTANRVAHEQMVKALSGEGSEAVSVSNGSVSLNLGPFVAQAKQSLVDSGFTAAQRIPTVNPQFVLFSSRDLAKAQTGYRILERTATYLPIIAIALIALGVYIAKGHRRALIGAGLGLAGSMLLLGIGLAIARTIYLDRIPESVLSTTTAASVYDTLVRFLRTGLRSVLVLGLVVAIAAFFSGPSVTAVRARGGVKGAVGWLRERGERSGLRTGPVGGWVHSNLKVLRIAVLSIAVLIFVFMDRPTGKDILIIAGCAVLVLIILEFLARPPDTEAAGAATG
jgi:hypothetical protein